MRSIWAWLLAVAAGLSSCIHRPPPPPAPVPHPHYQLGGAYEADGHWYYPAETYALDTTGIASVDPGATGLTADGEARDGTALVAAMQTIQLPAIVEVTSLANGRQITVRVNDRGPASPARVIALSPRAALLLQITDAAPVRVRVDTRTSHDLIDELGGGPQLAIAAAPRATIEAQALPPPGQPGSFAVVAMGAASAPVAAARVPDRLPEQIRMTYVAPHALYLRAGSFGRYEYAGRLAARLAGLGAAVERSMAGRDTEYAVRAGPFATITQADTALEQALRAGVVDARISVE